MIEHTKKYLLLIICLLPFASGMNAQAQSCFARVSVSPRQGVVRQPFKMTISVYTSTWFTAPLQFQNLQVDNAFILPYTRTTPSTNYINHEKYATLTFYYVIYPFAEGEFVIPSLAITATTPPEGDYKGVSVEIHTKQQKIKVQAVPKLDDTDVWNVASNMQLAEKWDKDLHRVKVGDVVNRTVKQYAAGTLPNFISIVDFESMAGVSMYSTEPQFKERRTENSINGELTQHTSYLFEKEGTVIMPEQKVYWYNPNTKKIYKRSLPEQTIQVQANPNLGMLTSLKDSLDTLNAKHKAADSQKKKLPWKRIVLITILSGLVLYYMVKKLIKLAHYVMIRRRKYLHSEKYKKRCFYGSLRFRNRKKSIHALYCWFDAYRMEEKPTGADISSLLPLESRNALAELLQSEEKDLSKQEVQFLRRVGESITVANSDINGKREKTLNPVK
ncbi:MAG: BatD family protein [Mangrovibacterium sp.]